ncbi:MAG TPA: FeoB-associated Cys-rich membrane protein [Sphaerochaetaceae bacterium]|nr:FeoB-associated Cys-rich membrane protein [Sphaerochaetaceae bacterium]
MANVLVGIVVFGALGAIVYSSIRKKKQTGSSCSMGCGGCPYACEERK